MGTKYIKMHSAPPTYPGVIATLEAEFKAEFPDNELGVNSNAAGPQVWVKISDASTYDGPLVLNRANHGNEHTTRVVSDVHGPGWDDPAE